jgi:hypothetical protein
LKVAEATRPSASIWLPVLAMDYSNPEEPESNLGLSTFVPFVSFVAKD